MAQLTSRLVVSLIDRVSGPARGIAASLKSVQAAGRSSAFVAMGRDARAAGQHMTGFATRSAAAGMGLYGLLQQTKQFNESNFGYGFAKMTEHTKNGRLNLQSWQKDMKATGDDVRKVAKQYGLAADDVMKAREQVEKLGLNDKEADSIFRAALGLHITEPDALATDIASSYMGAMFRAFTENRKKFAAKLGKSAEDDDVKDAWIKGIAGKTAIAAAESALGPSDVVEGLRQYAPQWASMGVSPEFAMAMLAHGSNYGFRAPELGTAFKSMGNRLVKPTLAGQRWLNTYGIKKTDIMGTTAQDPVKAVSVLQNLLGGSLDPKTKAAVTKMLREAQESGTTGDADFQERLTQRIMKGRGSKNAMDLDQVQDAVANSVLTSSGEVDIEKALKMLVDAKATPAALMEIFEGRHYARNTPVFKFWEQLHELYSKLHAADGSVIDNAIIGRKESYAGTMSMLHNAWTEFFLKLQDSGVIEGVKLGLIALGDAFNMVNPSVVKFGTAALVVLTAFGILAPAIKAAAAALGLLAGAGRLVGLGGAAKAGGAGLTGFGLKDAGKAGGRAATTASQRLITGMGANAQAGQRLAQGMSAHGARGSGWGSKALGVGGRALGVFGGLWGLYANHQDGKANDDFYRGLIAQRDGVDKNDVKLWQDYLWNPFNTAKPLPEPQKIGGGYTPGPAFTNSATGEKFGGQAVAGAQSSATEIKSILGGVDLHAEGARIMATLAAGMMSGLGAVREAAQAAADATARAAARSAFSDGAVR